jgi:hypothetical protein
MGKNPVFNWGCKGNGLWVMGKEFFVFFEEKIDFDEALPGFIAFS